MSRTQYSIGPTVVALVHDERYLDGDNRTDEQVYEPIAQEMYDACEKIAKKYHRPEDGVEVMAL